MTNISDLTSDILRIILSKLTFKEVCKCAVLNSHFCQESREFNRWKFVLTAHNPVNVVNFIDRRREAFKKDGLILQSLVIDFPPYGKNLPDIKELVELGLQKEGFEINLKCTPSRKVFSIENYVGKLNTVESMILSNVRIPSEFSFTHRLRIFDVEIGGKQSSSGFLFDFTRCSMLERFRYRGDTLSMRMWPHVLWPLQGENLKTITIVDTDMTDDDIIVILEACTGLKSIVIENCDGLNSPCFCSSSLIDLRLMNCSNIGGLKFKLPSLQSFTLSHDFVVLPIIDSKNRVPNSHVWVLRKPPQLFDNQLWMSLKTFVMTPEVNFSELTLKMGRYLDSSHRIIVSYDKDKMGGQLTTKDFGVDVLTIDGFFQDLYGPLIEAVMNLKPKFLILEVCIGSRGSDEILKQISRMGASTHIKFIIEEVNSQSLFATRTLKVRLRFFYE